MVCWGPKLAHLCRGLLGLGASELQEEVGRLSTWSCWWIWSAVHLILRIPNHCPGSVTHWSLHSTLR